MNDTVTREEGTAIAVAQGGQVTPMTMIAEAVRNGIAPEQLDKLLALQERWEANEAKKAYAAAFVAFKADAQAIIKNKHVSFKTDRGVTSYDHATLAAVCEDVIPRLNRHGLGHRWKVESLPDGKGVRVRTILLHERGHEEEVACFEGGADTSGGKNGIQGIGSTTAYFQRYGLLAGCGLATKDDDGRGADNGKKETEPDPAGKAALEKCGSLSGLQDAWKALTPEQRKTLAAVKNECKARIEDANKA